MMTNIYFLIMSLSFLPTMQNVADKICTENHNIHFMFNSPPPKIVPSRLCDNVGKYGIAGQFR